MSAPSTIVGTFSVDDFLQNYWQKQHLFVPRAWPGFESPLSPDELAGLSCEDAIEARLVTHTSESYDRPWRLVQGPLKEDAFEELGERDWTLLVQDVDKFVPEVSQLLRLVGFLPRWSVDDIMISYAAPGGSVGPHTDRYDVFLLQAAGTRRWSVGRSGEERLRQDTELKVLAEFSAEETFLAKPGDVLYLPPGVAHYGVAQDECLTYSFGFRAPTESALMSAFADSLVAQATEEQLRQRLSSAVDKPARISQQVLSDAREMIERRLQEALQSTRFLGRYLTEPKPHLPRELPRSEMDEASLRAALDAGKTLERSGASRFLYAHEEGRLVLFVDGEDFDLWPEESEAKFVDRLCGGAPIGADALAEVRRPGIVWQILTKLVGCGALLLSE